MTATKRWRRDLRVPGFDYSTPGTYFVTVCIQNRACILGTVSDGESRLSPAGAMIENHLNLTMDRYPNIELDSHIVMPNHLHALMRFGWSVDATPEHSGSEPGRHGGLQLRDDPSEHRGLPLQNVASLSRVMQWFKSATTNEYARRVRTDGWPRFPGKLWQPNYYEHIVRDLNDLDRIRTYIASNPGKWELDTEYSPNCPGFPC